MLEELKYGAIIGTSSARREVQLLSLRGDMKVKQLRGNVLTRLDKLEAGEYDGIILAAAGLKRLGMEHRCTMYFAPDQMIPSIGQGILGVQTRKDSKLIKLLEGIDSAKARLELEAERSIMIKLNGGCSTPIAAHAYIEQDKMRIDGMLATEDYSKYVKASIEGDKYQAVALGERLAGKLLEQRKELSVEDKR